MIIYVEVKLYIFFSDIICHTNDRQQADYDGSNDFEKKNLSNDKFFVYKKMEQMMSLSMSLQTIIL